MTENNTGKEINLLPGTCFDKFLQALVSPIKNPKGIIMNKSQYKNAKSEGRESTK